MSKTPENNATVAFWDSVASRYDEEIFNTLTSDIHGTLQDTIARYTKGVALACDFGCGVGRFVGLLGGLAERVVAVDFSKQSVALARDTWGHLPNVDFAHKDLARSPRPFCRADVGLSINVLVMPGSATRRAILKNTWRNLRPGSHLVLVVPSLEAALFTYMRFAEWYERDGDSPTSSVKKADREAAREIVSITGGLVKIDNTTTKHFLREEVILMLRQHRFEPVEELRVEYAWKEDIAEPPRWMRDPYPWDWLFVARRK